MSLLRIGFCVPTLSLDPTVGGTLTAASWIQQEYIAAGLRRRGHALTLLAPSGLADVTYTVDARQVMFAPRSWSRAWWFKGASSLAWRLQQAAGIPYLNVFSNLRFFDAYSKCLRGQDVVHERQSLYRIGVAMACKKLGLPYVLFFDADEILEHDVMGSALVGLLRWQARQMTRYNLDAASRVVCVSAAARTRLIDVWKVASEKIAVLPNAVDTERFRPDLESRKVVRRSLRVEGPLIAFVGGFYEWHDVATLLDAFAEIVRAVPDARLVLVGDGAQRDVMSRRAVELGIGSAVAFTGPVAHGEIPRLLAAADVMVAPYKDCGHQFWLSPMKVFEYMASGGAVIATKLGQLEDVITHGRNGLLVAPGDARAVAGALRHLLDQPGLRAQLGRRAREDAVRDHSWNVYVKRLEELYDDAIRARHDSTRGPTRRQPSEPYDGYTAAGLGRHSRV